MHPNDLPPPSELLEGCLAAVQAAGQHALRHRDRRHEAIAVAQHDVKLALDVECQQIAEETILSRYPGHTILGEEETTDSRRQTADGRPPNPGPDDKSQEQGTRNEGPGTKNRKPPCWVIDPIDGTVNFSHGMRQWCSSVAVQVDGETLAGAVFAPELEECYTAFADGPALCNGNAIEVSGVASIADAIVRTGLDKQLPNHHEPYSFFRTLADRARKTRVMGAAALDLCHVARGEADAYFEAVIYLWDVAAAGLIIERAGGVTRTLGRYPTGQLAYAASNGALQAELEQLLAAVPMHGRPGTPGNG